MEDRPDTPRTSYAQNGEDVVLWRALGSISQGNYVDVGAGHPEQDSLTKSLYDSGWSGINVEPLPQHAVALRTRRPRDLTFDVGAGSAHELVPFYGILGTGLSSTLPSVVDVATHRGFTITEIDIEIVTLDSILEQRFEPGEEIHLLNISTEGTEAGVLEGVDLVRWKPWVIVVSAVEANGNTDVRGKFESLLSSHGYTAALFNGIKAFYVSPAHPELEHNLSYPPCALDNYVVAREQEAHHRLTKEVVRWQSAWAMAETGLIRNQSERSRLEAVTQTARRKARRATAQRNRIEDSLWWRLTSPGRKIGRKIGGASTSSKRPKPSASNEPPANKSPSAPPGTEHTREEVLHERIRLLLAAIEQPTTEDQPFETTLQDVVRVLGGSNQPNQLLWMLYIVFHSRYPEESEVVAAQRRLRLDGAHKTVTEMSELAVRRSPTWASNAPIRFVSDVMVDVTHTCSHEIHTGVQRVVRETVSRWADDHTFTLVRLDHQACVYRPLAKYETDRTLHWDTYIRGALDPEFPQEILVPLNTQFVVPEIAGETDRTYVLAAASSFSGTALSMVFYDMIPYSLAEACVEVMPKMFSQYMLIVKRAQRISTISESVAEDLTGFFTAVKNQGLTPPAVRADVLPVQATVVSTETISRNEPAITAVPGLPIVLYVSSIEPRKNHVNLLTASEELWREGLGFQLLLIAGSGWKRENFDEQLAELREAGRPIKVIQQADESLLWSAYRLARFTVFISVTEGFGLPAAESIATGTPVLLSNFGSMREIGEGGGAEFVDPRNITQLTTAMRRLLTDDDHLAQLRAEAKSRTLPTWDNYAAQTWKWLVDGK